jgi:hypothetical protein
MADGRAAGETRGRFPRGERPFSFGLGVWITFSRRFLSPPLFAALILVRSSSRGNADHDGDCVGRDRRLRWRVNVACRPGRFRPRVPLSALRPGRGWTSHIGGTGEGGWWRATVATVPRFHKDRKRCHSRSRAAERTGTEIAGEALGRRHYFTYRGTDPAPRFPIFSLPREGSLTKARRSKNRVWR